MKSILLGFLVLLAVALRFFQAQALFDQQRNLFPHPTQGLFKVWVAEAPEKLFPREPGSHADGRQGSFYAPPVYEVRAVCRLLSLDGKPLPPVKARLVLKLSPDRPQPLLSYGEAVTFQGLVGPPEGAQNPGQFDYARFLQNQGVALTGVARSGAWRGLPEETDHGFFPLAWAAAFRDRVEGRVDALWPYPESALMSGILLGERVGLPQDLVETFIVTGTVHILAVAGLITAFVAGLLLLLLRVLGFPRKGAAALALAGLAFFVLLTGAHPPAFRAGLFSGLALVGIFFERRVWAGRLLLATAFLLVLANPFALADLSFQISFLATAGLMVLAPWLLGKFSFLGKTLGGIAAATLAAQVSVWALLLAYFNLLAVYSLPANLALVPLVLFSVAGGLAALVASLIHPFGGQLLAAGVFPALHLMMLLAQWIAHWPLAEIFIAPPAPGWMLLFHAWLLFAFWAFWPRPQPEAPSEKWKARDLFYRRSQQVAKVGGLLFLGLSAALAGMDRLARVPSLQVAFLAVGHGNAVVARSPGGGVLVVDGGKETLGPDRYLPLVSYLRFLGVGRVDAAIDTHPDEDHVGGLVNLASAYPLTRAYEGVGAQASTRIYRAFHRELAQKGDPLLFLRDGDGLAEMAPVRVLILHPPAKADGRLTSDNNRSVVSLLGYPPGPGGISVLLPGDLEKEGIERLLKNHRPFPKVDWLMAPHHGRLSGEPELCARGFHPRFVVFSDGVDYPQSRALYEKADPGVKVFSTALDGAVELQVFGDGRGRYRTFKDPRWVGF
ncbi:MAG TPA: ComEC/Rec2 family competence protein [bacterium]|nr:ComEC/Rec2 family competence protein [bacterium]